MVANIEDAGVWIAGHFFSGTAAVPAKNNGRPKAIGLTAEQFALLSDAVRDAAVYLADTAKFMKENELPTLTLPAAKFLDEHMPAVIKFSRNAFAESGPAATAHKLGRKTRLEHNQSRYVKAKTKKAK